MGDHGLLCRDCYEHGQPLSLDEASALPGPVQQTIYRRDDFSAFDAESGTDTFSTLS